MDGSSQPLAQGGRYDYVGEVFGRNAREATGFSIDVVNLAKESVEQTVEKETVLVRDRGQGPNENFWKKIEELRRNGFIVSESGTMEELVWVLEDSNDECQMIPSRKLDE